MRRMRAIEAALCEKYLVNRYNKLPDTARYSMIVAFEGEVRLGNRHAHLSVYVPPPIKKRISQSMLIAIFRTEFRFLWKKFDILSARNSRQYIARNYDLWKSIQISPSNVARNVYTVKDLRRDHVPWSRFEFVRPPKFNKFSNENLSVIRNRDRQRRAVLGLKT
ncbi:MAG: hypothetical protein ACXV2B_05350 [Halobacteriota archaeon]